MEFSCQPDWMGPSTQVSGPIPSLQYPGYVTNWARNGVLIPCPMSDADSTTEWFRPKFQNIGNLSAGEYAECGWAGPIVACGGMGLTDLALPLREFAARGEYLARLEDARQALAYQPKVESDSLASVMAYLRRSLDEAIRRAEREPLIARRTPEPFQVYATCYTATSYYTSSGVPLPSCAANAVPVTEIAGLPDALGNIAAQWDSAFSYVEPRIILRALAADRKERQKRHFHRRLSQIRRLVHKSQRTFCGHAWVRRLWHLLHGSHPPKTEGLALCQTFGGA